MVGREHCEKQDQHHKRDARVFLVEIQRRFPEPKAYCPGWHRRDEVRGLVAVYYVVLRAVLRKKPELRRYRARCRHCRIFFIADACNAGRKDLGCPFGCASLQRRRRSTERSVAYNGTPSGKAKRKLRAGARGGRTGSELGEGQPPGATPECPRDTDPRRAGEVRGGLHMEPDRPPPQSPASHCDGKEKGPEAAASRREDSRTPSGEHGAQVEAQDVHDDPRMVEYVRGVTSLIEGRRVSRAEVLEMLDRTRRQHSLARERRTEYVLRRLRQEPEKPP